MKPTLGEEQALLSSVSSAGVASVQRLKAAPEGALSSFTVRTVTAADTEPFPNCQSWSKYFKCVKHLAFTTAF